MSNKDFLFEIGCEELPPESLLSLAQIIGNAIVTEFNSAELPYKEIKIFATPRRLGYLVTELAQTQPAKKVERLGPSVKNAFDKNGMPTIACLGFAKSCGVSTDQLIVKKSSKGDRVSTVINQPGAKTKDILPEIINKALARLSAMKLMRWGNHDTRFIRPVHWVVMLYDHEIVSTVILGKKTSNETFGHRFHYPHKIHIGSPKEYNSLLQTQGYVIADFSTRKNRIKKLIEQVINNNEKIIFDEDLLNQITALVEWPVALKGRFNPKFLTVPKEVLITSMQTHQKCFAVENEKEQLQPCFILVSNIESKDPQTVIKGNERVINARLNDAAFFYKNDLKHPLPDYLPKLKDVIFQHEIGSLLQKSERISLLSDFIAQKINADASIAKQAGLLCKCDLLTEMVGEFPKLQGVMGYYYALAHNETKNCAKAIKDHYYPSFSGDKLPETLEGCAIALADRLDTLIGILGINRLPTGDKDPFKLRRAAQGILRILIEKELSLDLVTLFKKAHEHYKGITLPNTAVVAQAFDFTMSRLKSWYHEQSVQPEIFEAVMACHPTAPLDFHHRVRAVCEFQLLPEAKALASANKRVSNILKKQANGEIPKTADERLFESEVEHELAHQLKIHAKAVDSFYQQDDYTQALTQLSQLKQPVDNFFDHVMIMVEDKQKRDNRLALLNALHRLFTQVADISLLPS